MSLVNFPISDTSLKNTQEGGMFVRLVVVPKKDEKFMKCCGGYNYILYDETYIGDDNRLKIVPLNKKQDTLLDFENNKKYEEFHFPNLYLEKFVNGEKLDPFEQNLSRGYLCVMTLGSCKWSGFNEGTGEYWRCSYNDLTDTGKELMDKIKAAYPNELILLQTWLDT